MDDYQNFQEEHYGDDTKDGELEEESTDDRIVREFREIINAATDYSFDNLNSVNSFEAEYHDRFKNTNKTHDSLLHVFVEEFRGEPAPFGKWLVSQFPDLITVIESEGKTPLHLALDSKKPVPVFVELVLEDSLDNILAEALATKDNSERNCLHQAILTKSPSTLKLIEKCLSSTFTESTKNGDTPLHLAMTILDYKQAPKGQPPASDRRKTVRQRTHIDSEMSNSPKTSNDAEDCKAKNVPMKKNEMPSKNEIRRNDLTSKVKDTPTNTMEASARINRGTIKEANPPTYSQPGSGKRGIVRGGTALQNPQAFYLVDVVQSLIKHSKDSMLKRNSMHKTPYRYRLQQLATKQMKRKAEPDIILQIMKEYCLRSMGREDAIDMLYEKGQGTQNSNPVFSDLRPNKCILDLDHSLTLENGLKITEKHIEFDLSSLPSTSISGADLERLARHLRFEDTLQYVALPKLQVENRNRDSSHPSHRYLFCNSRY